MIIGITGLIGSGKDTLAKMLMEMDPSYRKMSFASRLKDMVAALYQWDREMLEGTTEENRKIREKMDEDISEALNMEITPRNQLQLLGTGLKSLIKQNFWASIVRAEILKNNYKNVVITDVRFPDEINMIYKLGGEIWEIQRGELPRWYETAKYYNWYGDFVNRSDEEIEEYRKIHPSEKEWIGVNYPKRIFLNNGSLDDLQSDLQSYYNENLKDK